jgi:hypothetical protein
MIKILLTHLSILTATRNKQTNKIEKWRTHSEEDDKAVAFAVCQ